MIQFKNVSLYYNSKFEVLSNVSFYIKPKSFYFVNGLSGSGKTSLLNLMFLSIRPTFGKIFFFGQNVLTLKRKKFIAIRRKIGMIFQDFKLLNNLTVYENISLPLRIQGYPEYRYRKDVVELIQWIDLSNYMNFYPNMLSNSKKQCVAIARAIIIQPYLLLADEPISNVDHELTIKLLHLFIELNKMGTSIIIATHNCKLMNQFNISRLNIKNGKIYLNYNESYIE